MSQPTAPHTLVSLQELRAPIEPWHPPLLTPQQKRCRPPKRRRERSASPVLDRKSFQVTGEYVDPVTGHHEDHFVRFTSQRHRNNPKFSTLR